MKLQNIKKVWEYYRGYQIRYRLGRSQYIVDAFNKNMNGDFSPSQFYNPIESRVHLIVQEYIKYLLEQEALEQAQQEQTTIDTQLKAPKGTNNRAQTTTPIEKTQKEQLQEPKVRKGHNSPPIPRKGELMEQTRAMAIAVPLRKGDEVLAPEGDKYIILSKKISVFQRFQREFFKFQFPASFCLKNSPPIPRKGGVARSDEVVKVHACENFSISIFNFILSNSPPESHLGGPMVQMRAIYQACLIIAECSSLKTESAPRSGEGLKYVHSVHSV